MPQLPNALVPDNEAAIEKSARRALCAYCAPLGPVPRRDDLSGGALHQLHRRWPARRARPSAHVVTRPRGSTMKALLMKRLTIATRLLWTFLVMASVPLSTVTYLTYTISEQSLRAEVTHNLRAIADSKANQIETYVRERQRNVTAREA